MPSNSNSKLEKRKLNELEQKVKSLQKEIRDLKSEKKRIGHLRKENHRILHSDTDVSDIITEQDYIKSKEKDKPRCKDKNCISDCITIDVASRFIIICQICNKRYSITKI